MSKAVPRFKKFCYHFIIGRLFEKIRNRLDSLLSFDTILRLEVTISFANSLKNI